MKIWSGKNKTINYVGLEFIGDEDIIDNVALTTSKTKKYTDLLSYIDIIKILTENLGFNNPKPIGSNFFFLCPFHNDHKPSLCFSPKLKVFKCFSCTNFNNDKAGNIFCFLSQLKNIGYLEAIKEISKMGFFSFDEEEARREIEKDDISFFTKLVTEIYHFNLIVSEQGSSAFSYLTETRKLKEETIKKFLLGCSINDEQLTNLLLKDERFISLSREENGYIKFFSIYNELLWNIDEKEKKTVDFFFKDVIIFPLKNELDQTISWAARKIITKTDEEQKYLFLRNSSNIINKGEFLYNFYEAKQSKENEYFLVEGFFDVISLTQLGVDNCIALLGKSATNKQLQLLHSLEKAAIIFLDNDKSGREGTMKLIVDLLERQINCYIVNPNYPDDPDELCRKIEDPQEIKKILSDRVNPFDFVIQHYLKEHNFKDNPQDMGVFIRNVARFFSRFSYARSYLVEQLQKILGLEKEYILSIFDSLENKSLENKPLNEREWLNKTKEELLNDPQNKWLNKSLKYRKHPRFWLSFWTIYWERRRAKKFNREKLDIFRGLSTEKALKHIQAWEKLNNMEFVSIAERRKNSFKEIFARAGKFVRSLKKGEWLNKTKEELLNDPQNKWLNKSLKYRKHPRFWLSFWTIYWERRRAKKFNREKLDIFRGLSTEKALKHIQAWEKLNASTKPAGNKEPSKLDNYLSALKIIKEK